MWPSKGNQSLKKLSSIKPSFSDTPSSSASSKLPMQSQLISGGSLESLKQSKMALLRSDSNWTFPFVLLATRKDKVLTFYKLMYRETVTVLYHQCLLCLSSQRMALHKYAEVDQGLKILPVDTSRC